MRTPPSKQKLFQKRAWARYYSERASVFNALIASQFPAMRVSPNEDNQYIATLSNVDDFLDVLEEVLPAMLEAGFVVSEVWDDCVKFHDGVEFNGIAPYDGFLLLFHTVRSDDPRTLVLIESVREVQSHTRDRLIYISTKGAVQHDLNEFRQTLAGAK